MCLANETRIELLLSHIALHLSLDFVTYQQNKIYRKRTRAEHVKHMKKVYAERKRNRKKKRTARLSREKDKPAAVDTETDTDIEPMFAADSEGNRRFCGNEF